jgi:hypothetical protein
MGAGKVNKKQNITVQYKEEASEDSLDVNENLKAVMMVDDDELSKHEDLLVQACFCEVPKPKENIYVFEQSILEKLGK